MTETRATITKEVRFEAAHYLPNVPASHQCSRMHGHSYRVLVKCEGPIDPDTGWVVDYGLIGKAVKAFDHQLLNEYLANPTAENLAAFLGAALEQLVPLPVQPDYQWVVTVFETESSSATVRR